MNNYCRPSLKNQSNQDFTVLSFVDESVTQFGDVLNNEVILKSKDYGNELKDVLIGGINQYLSTLVGYDGVIITRLDRDDCIRYDFIENVKKYLSDGVEQYVDINNSYTYDLKNNIIHDSKKYFNTFVSPFVSTYEKFESGKIKCIPFLVEHTKIPTMLPGKKVNNLFGMQVIHDHNLKNKIFGEPIKINEKEFGLDLQKLGGKKHDMGTTFNIDLNKTKILLAGPWVGEFGWELFCWQGHLRFLSKKYNKILVIGRPGQEFLYKDFASKYYSFNSPTSDANMWNGTVNQTELNELIKNVKYDIRLVPFNLGYGYDNGNVAIIDEKFNQQEFIKYKSDSINKSYDIIIHPRNKTLGSGRNWSIDNWQKLVDLLLKQYTVAIIGNSEAYKLKGVDDYRNVSIEDTISLLNRAKLVVGQSSGPLHLASLCGTPHFVWSEEYNRMRYTTHWNPHNTKVFFHSKMGWNPTFEYIHELIVVNMNEL